MQKVNIDLEDLVEVTFNQDDDFLKIRETLTRIARFLQEKKTNYISLVIFSTNVESITLFTSKNYLLLMDYPPALMKMTWVEETP